MSLVLFVVLILANVTLSDHLLKIKFNIGREEKRSLGYAEDSYLNFTELAIKYGYAFEEHVVTTEDGYVLRLFRIPHRLNESANALGPPVLAVHGLADSADAWIIPGPGYALGYQLVDAGYDMWFSNNRGNKHSRKHITLDPDKDVKFWKFSADEIAQYDIPAIIDYILKYRNISSINYIGHSQGTTVFFRLGGYETKYYERVNIMISLATVAWQTHTYNPLAREVSKYLPRIESLANEIGLQEFLADSSVIQQCMEFLCQFVNITLPICNIANFVIGGDDWEQIRKEIVPTIWGHFPSGVSLQNIIQEGQGIHNNKFQRFDYGVDGNIKAYGSPIPPQYNASLVSTPVALFIGLNDWLSSPKDVAKLRRHLPNVVESYVVPNEKWTHTDFMWGKDTTRLVGDKIIVLFKKYS